MTRTATLALLLLAGTALAQPRGRFAPVIPAEPPPDIRLPPIVPPEWTLLSQPAVRAELGLTKEQAAALAGFQNPAAGEAVSAASLGWLPPAAGQALLSAGRDAYLATGLTKAQQTRLKQILFQLKEKEFGSYAAFAMSARDLGLRPDQKEDVAWLKGQRVDEIARLVTSGERFEKVKGQVSAANTDTFEKMAEMLTRTQRERLKELRGKPFTGKVELTGPLFEVQPSVVKPVPPPALKVDLPKPVLPKLRGFRLLVSRYPAALFGVYDLELRYLATPEVRTELKVTPEQGKKLDAALDGWSKAHLELPGLDLDRSGRLHDRTAKALDDILQPDQRKRLGQIMMGRRLLLSPEAMCGHPAAVAALKLTPVQLKELQDGKSVAEVLTRDQAAALKGLPGAPFELPQGVTDPMVQFYPALPPEPEPLDPIAPPPLRPDPRSPAFAHNLLVIADRLKLSADQVKKLRELAEDEPKFFDLIQRELDFADTPPVTGAGRGLTAAGGVAEKFREAVEKQCWDVLDEKQRSLAAEFYGRRR